MQVFRDEAAPGLLEETMLMVIPPGVWGICVSEAMLTFPSCQANLHKTDSQSMAGTGAQRTEAGGEKEAELNEELDGLLVDMQGLTTVFDGLTRPGCLPPPGRSLSADQVGHI